MTLVSLLTVCCEKVGYFVISIVRFQLKGRVYYSGLNSVGTS